ncbi:MAG: phosphatase PAP2 family protein [Desulfurococcales archaeon]|nr:phosphatase PAP2 family protein [Desulfurococcales archaeon]
MERKAINKQELSLFAFLLVVLVLLLGFEVGGYFWSINHEVNTWIPHSNSFAAQLFTNSVDIVVILYIILVPIYFLYKTRRLPGDYVLAIISIIIAMILVALLKILVGEPRPGEQALHYSISAVIWNLDYFSFPSGHTARATVIAWYLGKGRSIAIKILLGVWAIGIAASRLIVNAHWFGDVITSLDLGVIVCFIIDQTRLKWIQLYNKLIKPLTVLRIDEHD